jgi:hypothetical protein
MTFMEVSEMSRFLAVRLTVEDHNGFHGLVDSLNTKFIILYELGDEDVE